MTNAGKTGSHMIFMIQEGARMSRFGTQKCAKRKAPAEQFTGALRLLHGNMPYFIR